MKKRVRFTRRELELILEMTCIADAGGPEGDYQDWDTDGKYPVLDSLSNKTAEMLRRIKK
jgi:hypothetical protein